MPVIDNFPRKTPIASEDHDGLMSKEDKAILNSLDNKKNSLMQITGRKIHTFNTINLMLSATNMVAGEAAFVLGSESILDDGLVRVYLISNDSTAIGSGTVLPMINLNLYAKLVLSIGDSSDLDAAVALTNEQLNSASSQVNARIANILNNVTTDSPTEVVDARLDENGVVYACLKDRLDALGVKVNDASIKRYGVKFNGSSSEGTRLEDAVGLVAEASTDSMTGNNDFDNIYPWSHMTRCNGYYTELGNFIITAYDGEPGFALDGSNGNVWVEIPKFFIKEEIKSDEILMYISGTRLDGYRLPEKFIKSNGTSVEKVYISAYNLSKLGAVSGQIPLSGNYNTLLANCEDIGGNHCGFTVDDYELIRFLFSVEYATRNCQNIMTGATSLCAKKSVKVISAGSTNGVIVDRTEDSLKLVVGQDCSIYASNDSSVIENIVISNITRCNANGAQSESGSYLLIAFTGESITIGADCYIVNNPWRTGATNSVLGPSGSPVSNTLNIYPCRYRYIENPWGNQWSVLYQIVCKNKGLSYSKDINGEYTKLSYDCPTENGYISSLGYDAKCPSCRFANGNIGGSSSSYFTDNFVAATDNNEKQVAVGGGLSNGVTSAGLYALNVSEGKTSSAKFGTRLSYNY